MAELAQNLTNLESYIARGVLVDQLTSSVCKFSRETVENYLQNFKEILFAKGVEICGEKPMDSSINSEITKQLKDKINTIVDNSLT